MTTLDDLKQIKKIDKEGMADFILDLPNQCFRVLSDIKNLKIPSDLRKIENIVLVGMGGSAIGGDLAKSLVADQLKIPFLVIRDWRLPCFVNQKTLVIINSYSGQTAETLECFKEAIKRKAKILAVSQGGKLEKLANQFKVPLFKYKYPAPPRAGFGYSFISILGFLEKLGLIKLEEWSIDESLKVLQEFNQSLAPTKKTEKNVAKYLAYLVFDHCPIILASSNLEVVARRWKTQINENGKTIAFWEALPEWFHNSIEGDLPWRLKDDFIFLILDDPFGTAESKRGLKILEKFLEKEGWRFEIVPGLAGNQFISYLSLIILGDWLSFYLAILNQIDPTPTEKIRWRKEEFEGS